MKYPGGKILINHIQFGKGKDIIFLHGWGGSTASFMGIAKVFSKNHRVTVVDFYGFGKTPHPNYPIFVEDYAKSVVEIINYYKMESVVIVGHSFGGRVAIRLASKYGYLLDKVILCDSAGIKPRRGMKYCLRVLRHKILKKLHIKHSAGSEDYRKLSGNMRQTFVNVVNEDLSDELKKITLPVLIIWGDKDRDTPIYMAKRMKREMRNSGLVIFRGAGHFSYIERSNEFCNILNYFLSGGDYEMGNRSIGNSSKRGGVVKIPDHRSK